ncbi:hypothetical protein PTKIN_Ptkin03bG0247200 [Pterospermum kingtungense]
MHAAEIFSPPNKEDDSDNGFRFDKSLQELRDLRSQLHYAADYCETTFLKSEEKRVVVDNTKDYICKAVVTFVDHLGNVSANLNHCISKTNAFSEAELRISSLKQRLLLCEQFAHKLALNRVQWNPNLPRHHRRYLSAPTMAAVEKSNEDSRASVAPSPAKAIAKHHELDTEGVPLFFFTNTQKPSLSKSLSLRSNFDEYDSDSALVPVHDGLSVQSKGSNPTFHFQKRKRSSIFEKAMDSVFAAVVQAPEDHILGVTVAYNKDQNPIKLNLGVGAYRTEEGKPLVLNVVRKAEQLLVNDQSRVKEYLPILGLAEFNKLSAKLILGDDSPAIQENRVATAQCLSGTGSLRVGAEFLAKHYHQLTIYIPLPSWGNHVKVFTMAGLSVKTYRYYDPTTRGLNFQGLLEDLGAAPAGAIVLLHACAHNPTGVDPTLEQWEQIRQLIRSKGLLPFFDSAYQGFASGSLDADAQPVRMFVADGGECLIAQSFAKNMGLYGERVGALSIVCKAADVASRVESQLKLVIRPMYSNPPIHGASIASTILKNNDMYNEWKIELKAMADRIISMRKQLYDALSTRGTPGDWSHIIKQIGMFTFTGLNSDQVVFMTKEYHIYMTSDGRISMAGLSSKTVPHLADAIHAAVTRAC